MKYIEVMAITMDEEGPHFIEEPSFLKSDGEKIEFATKLMTQTLMGNVIPQLNFMDRSNQIYLTINQYFTFHSK